MDVVMLILMKILGYIIQMCSRVVLMVERGYKSAVSGFLMSCVLIDKEKKSQCMELWCTIFFGMHFFGRILMAWGGSLAVPMLIVFSQTLMMCAAPVSSFLAVLITNLKSDKRSAISVYFSSDHWGFLRNYVKGVCVKLLCMAMEYAIVMGCFMSFNMPVCVLFPVCQSSILVITLTFVFFSVQSFVEELLYRKVMHHLMSKDVGFIESLHLHLPLSESVLRSAVSGCLFGLMHMSTAGLISNVFHWANLLDKCLYGFVLGLIHESELQMQTKSAKGQMDGLVHREGIAVTSAIHGINNTWLTVVGDTYLVKRLEASLGVSFALLYAVKAVCGNILEYGAYSMINKPYVAAVDAVGAMSSQWFESHDLKKTSIEKEELAPGGHVASVLSMVGL